MNHIIMSGRVFEEPVYTTSQKGKGILRFKVGVRRRYKNAEGKYENDYFNVSAFGNTADFASKNVTKDSIVIVEGEIQNNNWEKNGQKYYGNQILASSIEVPYGRDAAAKIYGNQNREQQQPQRQVQQPVQQPKQHQQHVSQPSTVQPTVEDDDNYIGMPEGFEEVEDSQLPF